MIEDLRFVKGAVGSKEIVTGLTHFKIEKGTVRSYNGTLALCSPIALDFDCTPKADLMVKAIEACEGTMQMTLLSNGKLSVRADGFNAYVPCLDVPTPHIEPQGELIPLDGAAFIDAFKRLLPFVGEDAYRPFCTGIRLSGQSAYATNNVIFVEYWLGVSFPVDVVIPRVAIRELLRIKLMPTHIQATEKQITFHFENGRWLTTTLITAEWPNAARFFEAPSDQKPIDLSIFDAIETIMPFADDLSSCIIENGVVRTHFDETEGAVYYIADRTAVGRYRMDMFKLLKGVAQTIDLTVYKGDTFSPSIFYGDKIRGVIVGIRL